MVTATRHPLTAAQAKSFNRYSVANASQVQARLKCGCEPYRDVFTYNRWRALGYQVMRGEKAIKLPIIIEDEEDGEVKKRFWTAAVFCRHQVKAINEPAPAATAKLAAIEEQQREIKLVPAPVTIIPQPATKQNDIMNGWRLIQ